MRICTSPFDIFSANTITVKFAFLLTNWSKNFMLKFMKENEHGTLVNINADVIVEKGISVVLLYTIPYNRILHRTMQYYTM